MSDKEARIEAALNNGIMAFRAAVIGCGRIGAGPPSPSEEVGVLTHAEALSASPLTALTALCDTTEPALEEAAARHGIDCVYTDFRSLLEDIEPEFVAIATPDETHAEIASAVLGCPFVKAVLLEKPIALTSTEGIALVEKAREKGISFAVNYSRRYAPRFQRLREGIRNGEIGELQSVIGLYTKGVFHNGSHWIDLVRFLTGREIGAVRSTPHFDRDGADPTPDVELKLDGDLTARLVGCDQAAYTVFEMDVIGTLGRLRIVESGHRIETYIPKTSWRYEGYTDLQLTPSAPDDGMKDVILHAVEDLVRATEEDIPPTSPGREALFPLAAGEAALASLRNGGSWQETPYPPLPA